MMKTHMKDEEYQMEELIRYGVHAFDLAECNHLEKIIYQAKTKCFPK